MKILVTVKRVIDYKVKIQIKTDGSGVETRNVKMAMNPFCEIAVEEAIRIKERGIADEIIVVSIGTKECQETLRAALALGADRGVLVQTEQDIEPIEVAKLLKAIVNKYQPQLVITGKQAIDDDCNQTGQMLANFLGWPQATFASKLSFQDGKLIVEREVDSGIEIISVSLPAVVTTDLRLNQPRYASLPNIMRAKQKIIDTLTPEELGIELQKHTEIINFAPPSSRKSGTLVKNFSELMDKLKTEAKVLS